MRSPKSQISLFSYLTSAIIISIVLFVVSVMPVFFSICLGVIVLIVLICMDMAKTKYPKTALCSFFCLFALAAFIFIGPALIPRKCGSSIPRKISNKISNLEAALKQYETDFGELPPHVPKTFDGSTLVIYLDGDTSNGGPETAYFEFESEELDSSGRVVDFYNRSFHYRQRCNPDGSIELSTILKNKFDLWSEGEISIEEGDTSGSDDIANWKE